MKRTGEKVSVSFRGKTYWLLKQKRGTSWTLRVAVDGKRYQKALKTSSPVEARKRSREVLEKLFDGSWERDIGGYSGRKSRVPSVGEVLGFYGKKNTAVREKTNLENQRALLLILTKALSISRERAMASPLEILEEGVALRWLSEKQGRELENPSWAGVQKENTGANSVLRHARCIFTRQMLREYQKAGFVIPPCVKEFLAVRYLKEPSHKYSDDPIPEEAIARLWEELPELKQASEPMWAVVCMALTMGLRASEIFRSRRGWLKRLDGRWYLQVIARDAEEAPKRRSGVVPVPEFLLEFFSGSEDFLIPGTRKTARENLIYKETNRWLRQFIPDRVKCLYELRKHAGSVVATKTDSIERAAEFLRISVNTAEKHYAAFLKPIDALAEEDFAVTPVV